MVKPGQYELPGQTHETPPEKDPERIFYSSLVQQILDSEMGIAWCVSRGLLSRDRADEWVQKQLQLKAEKKKRLICTMPKRGRKVRVDGDDTDAGDRLVQREDGDEQVEEERGKRRKISTKKKNVDSVSNFNDEAQDEDIEDGLQTENGGGKKVGRGGGGSKDKSRGRGRASGVRRKEGNGGVPVWRRKERFYEHLSQRCRDVAFFDGGLDVIDSSGGEQV
eukprot:TRINITY_DN13043_c0_g2_i1.p3 TRINITY_DN13043_c0_g2~~TRINITY_DN13043_c0_g2_i1.p3  ORF type:complete len:221 (-),score=38.03 TRINITY_DN13043_c0_g2_i1:386-1048(-)